MASNREFFQDSDPGAVGAGCVWVDTTDTPFVRKRRNAGNSAWVLEFDVPSSEVEAGADGEDGDPGPAGPGSGTVEFLGLLVPDASGNAWREAAAVRDSNNLTPTAQLLIFNNGGSALINAFAKSVPIPSNWSAPAAPKLNVEWYTTATTGAVVLSCKYAGRTGTETMDPAAFDRTLSATVNAPGTTRLRTVTQFDVTAADLAANDTMIVAIGRDKSSGSDTAAAPIFVSRVWLSY